jgi:kinetochore protein Spc7/SPC105
MLPGVKSILSTNHDHTMEDIAKRKAARRKSLANRRVSFAPEATLHTWDVVEYVKDATSSSSSSSSASDRRASNMSQTSPFKSPVPAANSTESASPERIPESPMEAEPETKRRRSSGVPNLNFDDDDDFSSSPIANSPKETALGGSDDDMGDVTMDLDVTGQGLEDSGDSTSSSARLEAALRQATEHAGIHRDEIDDMTMEMADDEVTNAFTPWMNQGRRDTTPARPTNLENQENINPFGSSQKRSWSVANEETENVSMDITRAVGGIIRQENEDQTMELSMDITRAIGGIVRSKPDAQKSDQTRNTRSRRSSAIMPTTASSGSPMGRTKSRRSLRGREESTFEDQTMDFTSVVGGIRPSLSLNDDESLEDATMDFTMAVGTIRSSKSLDPTDSDNELSMELTENLGKTLAQPVPATPSPRRGMAEPLLPPSVTVERGKSPKSRSPAVKSPRRSPRKSLMFGEQVQTPQRSAEENQSVQQRQPAAHAPIIIDQPVDTTQSLNKSSSLANSLRMLATPRKEILAAPSLRPTASDPRMQSPKKFMSPNKATPRATPRSTPRSTVRNPSPLRKQVKMDVASSPEKADADEFTGPNVSLPQFLDMTNIRFMDLTTTKRRATGHPGADGQFFGNAEDLDEGPEPSFENNVAAAVAVIPTLVMYQHASITPSKLC